MGAVSTIDRVRRSHAPTTPPTGDKYPMESNDNQYSRAVDATPPAQVAGYQPQATVQSSPAQDSSTKGSPDKVKTVQITEPLLSPAQF